MPSDIIHDPAEIRRQCRAGTFNGYTAGQAPGRVQANLMIVPRAQAYDFSVFCQRNPKPCPVLDITDPGDPEPRAIAPGADIRRDLPCYRVFRHGELVDEPTDISDLWRDDLVGFLIGCSYTFEDAMTAAGLPIRHVEEGVNTSMYRTDRDCAVSGGFSGPMVVSMRPMTPEQAAKARTGSRNKLTGAFLTALSDDFGTHGAKAIADLREKDVGAYVRVVASLAPKELHISDDNPFAGIEPDILALVVEEGRRIMAARGGDGTGEDRGGEEPAAVH